jgi:predicted alpha/beta-fold hydrolase
MSAHNNILTRGRRAVCACTLAVLGLSLGTGLLAPAAAQTTPAAAPLAAAASKAHVDMRSDHYRLRRKCTAEAEAQGLSGDALKLQVQKCLSGR